MVSGLFVRVATAAGVKSPKKAASKNAMFACFSTKVGTRLRTLKQNAETTRKITLATRLEDWPNNTLFFQCD